MNDDDDDTYEVVFSPAAGRALNRLPRRIVHAVIEFIAGPLAQNPARSSKPLHGELEGLRSARRGDYRVLVRLQQERRTVLIVDIDHRAHIYRT